MARLYPPQIEGVIPAFYGTTLVVPFVMNKTVSNNQVIGMVIKIKSIYNNSIVYENKMMDRTQISFNKQEVYFTIPENTFNIGVSYKVQLAYVDTEDLVGYYSTVGIVKYTAKPEVTIEGLKNSQLHSDTHTYIGNYSQYGKDVTEKVYSYNFTIYNEDDSILETSGELLHNHENDDQIYESSDNYTIIKSLEENKIYKIVYTVTTANGLVISSPKYRITLQSTIPPEINASLIATMNEENGYVDLQLVGDKDTDGIEKVGTGTFLICRASSEDNYGSWSEIDRFALFGEKPSSHNWKDFTVQHGFTYIYSLQQYNKEWQIYSNRMLSNSIVANFEHSFLYDGKRQLKIKYNPKVTSFKETMLETKTNTLGGKYPYFFRNGNVRYKEFPISGLVSYHSDEEELFLTNEDLLLEDLSNLKREHTLKEGIKSTDYDYFNDMLDANIAYKLQEEYKKREQNNSQENQIARKKDRTTNLTDYNILAERIFKMKVLEFLNDGKPKLFRSPGEGNYIVRLMNSSLAPDDKLNRMIHTFSTTATEIDEFNYQKLNEYSLISATEPDTKQLRWKTVNIRELINTNGGVSAESWLSIGGENNIMSIQCLDMIPGDSIKILYAAPDNEERIIQIGTTGAYYVEFSEAPQWVKISSLSRQGQITYSYCGTSLHHFDTYRRINMDDIPVMQLRGSDSRNNMYLDIREAFKLEDIKHKITKYYFLNFTKDYNYDIEVALRNLQARYVNKEIQQDQYEKEREAVLNGQIYKFWIDDKEIDITETTDYQLIKPEHIPEIRIGNGICLDISIQRREIEYDVEENDTAVANAKIKYIEAQNRLLNWIRYNNNSTDIIEVNEQNDNDFKEFNVYYEEALKDFKEEYQKTYSNFLKELDQALRAKEVLAE